MDTTKKRKRIKRSYEKVLLKSKAPITSQQKLSKEAEAVDTV